MTTKVKREDLLDYVTWTEQRDAVRPDVLAAKRLRRIHVGDHLTFLFENADTIRYQIQEMMRIERLVKEADIRHELDTYNEILGDDGELGCTLLVEVESEAERAVKLREWLGLQEALYVVLEDGERVYATYDPRQVGEDRLSSVQYLKFPTGGRVPVAVGVDHPAMSAETRLTDAQRQALAADLA